MNIQFGYVYKTTNLVNGRTYIGQRTGEFSRRYLGSGVALKSAVLKYGRRLFSVEFVQSAFTREELDRLECLFIANERMISDPYNITNGGGGMNGFSVSAETRDKIRKSLLGRKLTPEHCAAVSRGNKGRKLRSEEINNRRFRMLGKPRPELSKAMKGKTNKGLILARLKGPANLGRVLSESWKENISKWQKGRPKTEAQKAALRATWARRKAAGLA